MLFGMDFEKWQIGFIFYLFFVIYLRFNIEERKSYEFEYSQIFNYGLIEKVMMVREYFVCELFKLQVIILQLGILIQGFFCLRELQG